MQVGERLTYGVKNSRQLLGPWQQLPRGSPPSLESKQCYDVNEGLPVSGSQFRAPNHTVWQSLLSWLSLACHFVFGCLVV